MSQEFNFPTEVVELPSKGLLYPEDSPLSSGKVEMKYMTAKEEDILTNVNYIQQGIVIDKLLESMITSNINFDELLIGDKNALLVAARILGYGKDYEFSLNGEKYNVDLTQIEAVKVDESLYQKGSNRFNFTLPTSKINITFKLLTHKDERLIEEELAGLRKISGSTSKEFTTRLRYMILEIEGDSDRKRIKEFVDNYFLVSDTRAFRKHINSIQPDVDLKFYPKGGPEGGVEIPLGISFFWPDAGV